MSVEINRDLIFRHFKGETTPLQRAQIEVWMQREENQECFFQWLVEWEKQFPLYTPTLETPLAAYISYMENYSNDVAPAVTASAESLSLSNSRFLLRLLVAATLTAVLAIGGWLGRELIIYRTYHTDYGQTQTIRLEEGSIVTLNANSSLQVPRFGFGRTVREVFLTGEAFFSVTHLPAHNRFVVNTPKGFDVVVHGTEFAVNTRSQKANVVLSKGKVEVNYLIGSTKKKVMMAPGDLVVLSPKAPPKVVHQVKTQLYTAWKEHRFVFDNMTLQDVAQLISETYGLTVLIPDQTLAKRTLEGAYQAQDAEDLLHTVAELFDLQIDRQGRKVILSPRE